MKFKDLMREEIDIDIYDDYDERCGMALCGPVKLTEAGKAVYGDLLDLECKIYGHKGPLGYHAVVNTDDDVYDEAERKTQLLLQFLLSAAGYIPDAQYKEWFLEV